MRNQGPVSERPFVVGLRSAKGKVDALLFRSADGFPDEPLNANADDVRGFQQPQEEGSCTDVCGSKVYGEQSQGKFKSA